MILFCLAQISSRISLTTSILSWMKESEASMTCRSRSDSMLSSNVEENDLISFGRQVANKADRVVEQNLDAFPGFWILHNIEIPTCVHNVAKKFILCKDHFFVRTLEVMIFQYWYILLFLLSACLFWSCLLYGVCASSRIPGAWPLSSWLSLSSAFSSFPYSSLRYSGRSASWSAAQPCLESSIPIPKILGPICLMAASSIWSLDSMLSACFPKIFKIKSILSRASAFMGRRSSFKW